MKIIQITPGAGAMFCGGCFRDNALVKAWRDRGHDALMLPLYLPMTLDEEDQSRGTPIFYGGINVYLQQKSSLFGKLPSGLHRLLASPKLLKWASGSAAKTRPQDVGELTLSMLRGEQGQQQRELDELVGWLKDQIQPDVICLSNVMLIGMVRRLKAELRVPVACLLAGEDSFLDSLPAAHRQACWDATQDRARDLDCFIAASHYYREVMQHRLNLSSDRVKVIYGGASLEGYEPAATPPNPPVLGYFARMCQEKGLPTLVDAFIHLKQRNRVPGLRLRVGGGMSPVDEQGVVKAVKEKLQANGLLAETEFYPNLTREEKVAFYRSLSVFSVPALYGEAFGLYLAEAWASGVPVVQPRHGAFPELIELSQGGLLCEPNNAAALGETIEQLLLDPGLRHALGQAGRTAARERFSVEHMAEDMVSVFSGLKHGVPALAGR